MRQRERKGLKQEKQIQQERVNGNEEKHDITKTENAVHNCQALNVIKTGRVA
jgi:hypothetical protein